MVKLLFFAATVLAAFASPASLCKEEGDWKLAWEDDFNKPLLDTSVWTVPVGPGNSFGRQANVTVEDTYVENGTLVLRSRQLGPGNWTTGAAITNPTNPFFESDKDSQNSSSSSSSSMGKSWQYGRFCIRAKLPGSGPGKSQGLWPAHWMMPSSHSLHCGYNEMDVLEMINGDGTAWGTYWYWGPGDNCTGPPVRAGDGSVFVPDYYSKFHEYAIEWTPTSLTYFVDQKPYKNYTDPTMLPVNPHFMMLNTAVGGSWPGPPNTDTVFPAYHYIDFVRVTQKASY